MDRTYGPENVPKDYSNQSKVSLVTVAIVSLIQGTFLGELVPVPDLP